MKLSEFLFSLPKTIGNFNDEEVKIGIGNLKHEKQDLKDFVLEKFNKAQKDEIDAEIITKAIISVSR